MLPLTERGNRGLMAEESGTLKALFALLSVRPCWPCYIPAHRTPPEQGQVVSGTGELHELV